MYGTQRSIGFIARTINCMSDEWPVSGGPAVDEAVLVCLDAVLGKASAEQSRRAFLEAAEEAGLDVRPDAESLH